ncbi:transcription initiation factor TFIID subunit 4-like [Cebus imitator]|uniref:transcription initiation factor TFIID subunit 4-like n=1 Tax=Cebus imitator TaxID=2715852 RepID=UPI00189AF298|nr:transcription initiation factor TFIID subunit 4-like [Cebus imitator]
MDSPLFLSVQQRAVQPALPPEWMEGTRPSPVSLRGDTYRPACRGGPGPSLPAGGPCRPWPPTLSSTQVPPQTVAGARPSGIFRFPPHVPSSCRSAGSSPGPAAAPGLPSAPGLRWALTVGLRPGTVAFLSAPKWLSLSCSASPHEAPHAGRGLGSRDPRALSAGCARPLQPAPALPWGQVSEVCVPVFLPVVL